MSRRSVWGALAALSLLASACGAVTEPRWDARTSSNSSITVEEFETPRQVFVVQAEPDIGSVAFRGTVRGRSPHQVVAPSDGRVLEVFVASNEEVSATDPILVFLPDPTEAELIDLEIAQLEIDRAVAAGDTETQIANAQKARDNLAASYEARTEVATSGAGGLIGSTRQNISYSVDEGQVLFEIADPNDLVVEVIVEARDLEFVSEGAEVTLTRTTDASGELLSGTVVSVPGPPDSQDDTDLVVSIGVAASLELGERFVVALPIAANADARWIPLQAVGRSRGSSFLLVADEDDRLRRLDVTLGRRTLSHVQVLSGVEVGMRLVGTP